MAKNERGEEMVSPNQKTLLQKYCIFAPDGLPIFHTISDSEEDAADAIEDSFSSHNPLPGMDGSTIVLRKREWTWEKIQTLGATCQKVIITIEINEP